MHLIFRTLLCLALVGICTMLPTRSDAKNMIPLDPDITQKATRQPAPNTPTSGVPGMPAATGAPMSARDAEMAAAAMIFQMEQGTLQGNGQTNDALGLPMLPPGLGQGNQGGQLLPGLASPFTQTPRGAGGLIQSSPATQQGVLNSLLSNLGAATSAPTQSSGALPVPALDFLGVWHIQFSADGYILSRRNGVEQRTVAVTGGSFGPKPPVSGNSSGNSSGKNPAVPEQSQAQKDHKPNAADTLESLVNPNAKLSQNKPASPPLPTSGSSTKANKAPDQLLAGHPALQGTILPHGEDWQELTRSAQGENNILNIRLVLRTHDNALITQSIRGYRHGSPEIMRRLAQGETVPADQYYFRLQINFESSAPQYEWLNTLVCVGTAARQGTDILMDVYALR